MGQFTSRHGSEGSPHEGGRWAAVDANFGSLYPALCEFLTERETEEGKPRVTSTLFVAAEDGMWKVMLCDRAQPMGNFDYKMWKSADTLGDALAALDRDLQEGTAEWRKFAKWKPPPRR